MPAATNHIGLTIRPLHDTFVAEVQGVPWDTIPLPDAVVDDITAAADKYGVLVFRNANLNNEEHIRFSQQLGELMDVKAHIAAGRKMRFPDQPEIFDVSNLDDKNQIVTNADPARLEGSKGNFLWHADMTYDPNRAKYSCLRAVELPPKGTGGETKYIDSRTAYEDLPQDMKDELEDLVTHNSLFHNRKTAAPEFFANVEPTDYPMARYKLIYPHEGSGRKNLYLTTYAYNIDGRSREQSQPLFDQLWAHLTQDKYIVRTPPHPALGSILLLTICHSTQYTGKTTAIWYCGTTLPFCTKLPQLGHTVLNTVEICAGRRPKMVGSMGGAKMRLVPLGELAYPAQDHKVCIRIGLEVVLLFFYMPLFSALRTTLCIFSFKLFRATHSVPQTWL